MKSNQHIAALFTDIGGVLLTNGWDRSSRQKAADIFHLDENEIQERHHLTYDTYEEGKLSLDEYLDRVIFYRKRSFTRNDFREFMYEQSQPHNDMISLVRNLKKQYGLKVGAISNEGRELSEFRISKFMLNEFVDFFVSSSFVHTRKPDADIFRIAIDISQVPAENAVYIDDREMFVEIAETLGIRGVYHIGFDSTREQLAALGLREKVVSL